MTSHALGTEYKAESKSARRTITRSVRAHSSHSHRIPPTLSTPTASRLTAKTRRINTVVIALSPRGLGSVESAQRHRYKEHSENPPTSRHFDEQGAALVF